MTHTVTVKGPRWVAEIRKADGSIIGSDFQFRQQLIDWVRGQPGTLDITEVKAGQSLTYIKSATIKQSTKINA